MYPWKHIRVVCLVLLLLPLAHLFLLVATETADMLNPSPETWRDELDAFAAKDSQQALPEDPILLVGGRRAWLWRDLDQDLAPRNVLLRGLSGATLEDIEYHYERLVGYYQPQTLVVITGIAEFHLRDDKSVDEYLDAVKTLEALDREHREQGAFYLIAPLKTVLFPGDDARIERINQLLRSWANSQPRVTLLDPNNEFATTDGGADPTYFRPDGVNLNELGYDLMSEVLRDQLDRDEA